MGVTYDKIPTHLIPWIQAQHLFFVASSALAVPATSATSQTQGQATGECAGDLIATEYEKSPVWGYANVSPRDMAGFEVLSESSVRFQDLTGSGVETISHLHEPGNGRLTIMFIALEGGPRIIRLWGKGKVYERNTPEFDAILPPGDPRIRIGCRAIIELDIKKVGTSCGYSIPYYTYQKERPILDISAKKQLYRDLGLPLPSTLTSFDPKSSDPESQTRALEDGLFDEEERVANEEAFTELVAEGGVATPGGMRDYWNLKNSRSRDLLVGLKGKGVAPINGEDEDEIIHVNVGGDELRVRKLPGGRGELVTDETPAKPATKPLTTIDPTKTYSGAEVLTLLQSINRNNLQAEAGAAIDRQKTIRRWMGAVSVLLGAIWLMRSGPGRSLGVETGDGVGNMTMDARREAGGPGIEGWQLGLGLLGVVVVLGLYSSGKAFQSGSQRKASKKQLGR